MTEQDASKLESPAMAKDPASAVAEPSHEERGVALVAEFEHAHKHNSPISNAMLAELKALLG